MSDLKSLAPIMIEKTREGKISWDAMSSDMYTFDLEDFSIVIQRNATSIPGKYQLTMMNSQGDQVDSYVETAFPYNDLKPLFDLAKRDALKVDESLSHLETALKAM